jgi:LysM repeat protein
VKCEPKNPALLFSIGRYWVWRARLLPEQPAGNTPSRQQGIDRFQHYFKQALALDPSPWEAAVRHVWEYFPQDATVMGIVPVTDPDLRSRVLQFLVKLPPPAPLVAELPQTALKAPDTEPEAPSNSVEQEEEVLSKTDGDQPPASPPAIAEKTTQEVRAEKTTQEAPAEKTAQQTAAPRGPTKQFHTVQSGENLFRIGLRYGLTVDVLRRMNQMDEGDTIYPGQELVVGTRK